MIEPEMYAFACHRLAIVTVNKPLDELPLWMARETIAAETGESKTRILIDSTDMPQWTVDPAINMNRVACDALNFSFGSGWRQVHVYLDAGPNKDTSFVVVGKSSAFGPRFGGTL